MRSSRPIVIGGGPAGSAAAILLCKADARPIIYERQEQLGDALCGGFLSWSTLRRLQELGVTEDALGGQRISKFRLTMGQRDWLVALPQTATGVSRERLDGQLLARAEALGAEIRRDTVSFEQGAFHLSDGSKLDADSLFLATGKYDMRGLPRDRSAAGRDPFLGLRVSFAASPTLRQELSGLIEMHLFRKGYAGLILQEDERANLCMAVRKSRLAAASGSPERLLADLASHQGALGKRIASLPDSVQIDAIGNIPYGWHTSNTQHGLFRLGDQAGVIPSLAGEGIAIALASAEFATRLWQEQGPAASLEFQRVFSARLRPRLLLAVRLAQAATHERVALALGSLISIPGLAGALANATRI